MVQSFLYLFLILFHFCILLWLGFSNKVLIIIAPTTISATAYFMSDSAWMLKTFGRKNNLSIFSYIIYKFKFNIALVSAYIQSFQFIFNDFKSNKWHLRVIWQVTVQYHGVSKWTLTDCAFDIVIQKFILFLVNGRLVPCQLIWS